MTAALRLVIFDVDGTLVDSQGDIVAAMTATFDAVGQPAPDRATMLSVVGLSLEVLMPRLAPDLSAAQHDRMVEAYKQAYVDLRAKGGVEQSSPLYPGARAALEALQAQDHTLLGVATGKSRRGLDKLIEGHGLEGLFLTQQVADHHPSKPHPAMVLQAMADMGVEPAQTVMIGDTSFDMEMARAAGAGAIGVSWGYHPRDRLHAADRIIEDFAALPAALDAHWRETT